MHNLARLDLRLRQVSGSPQEQPFVPRSAQATQVLRCQRTYDDKCPQMFNDNAKLWEWVRVCESIIILNCNFYCFRECSFNPSTCWFGACLLECATFDPEWSASKNEVQVVNVRCLTSNKHFNQSLSWQKKIFTLLVQVGDPTWAWHHPELAEKTMQRPWPARQQVPTELYETKWKPFIGTWSILEYVTLNMVAKIQVKWMSQVCGHMSQSQVW